MVFRLGPPISTQHPFEPLVYSRTPVVLPWAEGVALVREQGGRMGDEDDLTSDNEKLLGRAVRAKYNTDLFILDGVSSSLSLPPPPPPLRYFVPSFF